MAYEKINIGTKVPYWLKVFLIWKGLLIGFFLLFFYSNSAYYNPPSFNVYKNIDYWGQAFMRWDGQVYLTIAKAWYADKVTNASAFYPLFPLIIKGFASLGLDYFYSAFLVTIILGAALFYYFYEYSGKSFALLLFLAYPPAFYLTAIYSEVLFLFLLFGLLSSVFNQNLKHVAIFSFLLIFTRGQGFFVAGAFGLYWILLQLPLSFEKRDEIFPIKKPVQTALISFFVSTICFLLFQWFQVGSAFGAFQAQKFFGFNNSILNIFKPWNFIDFMVDENFKIFDYLKSLNDRFFIILNFFLIFTLRQRFHLLELLIAISLAVLPAIMGQGGSYIRFSLLSFSLIAIALSRIDYFSSIGHRGTRTLLCISCVWQLILIARFVTNLWVA